MGKGGGEQVCLVIDQLSKFKQKEPLPYWVKHNKKPLKTTIKKKGINNTAIEKLSYYWSGVQFGFFAIFFLVYVYLLVLI